MWISSNFFIVGVVQSQKLNINNNFSFSPSSYMLKILSNELVTQNVFYTIMILLLDKMNLFFYCEIFLSILCAFVSSQFFLILSSILPNIKNFIKTLQKLSAILIFFLSYFIFRQQGNKIISKIKRNCKKMITKGVSLETEKAMDKFLDSIDPKFASTMEESFFDRIDDSIKIIKTMNENHLTPLISEKFSVFFVSILHLVIVHGLGSLLMKIVPFYTGDETENSLERINLIVKQLAIFLLQQIFGKEKCVSELLHIFQFFRNVYLFLNVLSQLVPVCSLFASFLLTILLPSFNLQSDSKSTFLSMLSCLPTAKSTDIEGNLIKISEKISIKDLDNKVWTEFIFIGLLFFVSSIFILIILLSYKNIVKNINSIIDFLFLEDIKNSFLHNLDFPIFGLKIINDSSKKIKPVNSKKEARNLLKNKNPDEKILTEEESGIEKNPAIDNIIKLFKIIIIFVILSYAGICLPKFYYIFRNFFLEINNNRKIIDQLNFLSCITLVKTEGIPVENIISFQADNVDLCYFPGDPVVKANFLFETGTFYGILGQSGCGKTSVSKGLKNEIRSEKNSVICSDGFETYKVEEVKKKYLKKAIGFCPQELKFEGNLSVIQALRVHAPLLSRDRAIEILQKMELSNWINDSPHGLDTMLGNNALTLSGGQRARLAIAMLYAKIYKTGTLFLFLDESLDSLDEKTANEILKALLPDIESGKLCLIVISHKIMVLLENLRKERRGVPYKIFRIENGLMFKEDEGEI